MIWKPDYTGRFPQRPHWESDELERRCEEVMGPFLEGRYGQAPVRVPTDASNSRPHHADSECKLL
jgi:hypothetical protein